MLIGTKRAAILFLLLLAGIGQACARELSTRPVFAIVVSGERTKVSKTFHLNPDCSPAGKIIARFAEHPKNGTAEIVNEKGFTDYDKESQERKCNERESEIIGFYYTSREGFIGKDKFIIEIFYPNGNYRKRVINVEVR
jgi:hypothetical protein